MQRNQDNKISHTASWYDSSDRNNSWSVSASGDNDEFKDMKASLRASYQHNTENGRLYLSGTSQRDSYYSLNASWNGSFTATRHGAAFHDYSGSADSRFMIDADGAEDIPLNNKRAVTNRYGIGVIPSVSSYITTSLSVDTRNLPENVDIENSVGFAPIFPDTCYHLTHYWPAAADIPVASDNPVHYADAIRYNARTPLQGSLLPLTRLVWA
ncbi:type VII secretion system (T7SS), usher family protein [Escherichia coli P0302293.10]|nr:type VII secretion system (T7SS), usher family protein [Escherichia coli P0302293.10]